MPGTDTAALVDAFARRFLAALPTDPGVASPLGAWLLLALVAPVAPQDVRPELEAALGTTAVDAAARARALLDTPHPSVAAGVAAWHDVAGVSDVFAAWAAALPSSTTTGPVPDQAHADAWAKQATAGLLDRLPVDVEGMALVLVTALACRVRWVAPFEIGDPGRLDGFNTRPTTALASPPEHDVHLARTPSAGVVAVHVAEAAAGLAVLSVIAAPDVPPAQVQAAAGEVAALLGGRSSGASRLSAFDVDAGPGHAWTVTESVRPVWHWDPPLRGESARALLPAWTAKGDHDLATMPGVAGLAGALGRLLRGTGETAVRQAVVARYTAEGFDAAALTGLAAAGGAVPEPVDVPWRELEVVFDRPYAALAVAGAREMVVETDAVPGVTLPTWRDIDAPAWVGMPVFSAWVADPG